MAANPRSDVETESYQQRYHVYHAEAKILSGQLKHPIEQPIDFGGHVVLSKTRREGHITRSMNASSLEGLISFKSGFTRASGNKIEKKDLWGNDHSGWVTLSTAVIEGLNVLEVITADRVVAQVSTEHPFKRGHVPKVTFLGSRFENLRIGGYPVELEFDLGICGDRPPDDRTYLADRGFLDRVEHQFENITRAKGLPESLEREYKAKVVYIDDLKKNHRNGHGHSKLECSLVKSIGPIPIPGVKSFGNILVIPDFGTVSLGEIIVGVEPGKEDFSDQKMAAVPDDPPSASFFTLNMLKMHMGCIAGGSATAASANTNGVTRP